MPRSNTTPQLSLPILLLLLVTSSSRPTLPRCSPTTAQAIVVLILENRSFDHMLGWMKQSINPAIDGLTDNECNPGIPNSKPVCIFDDAQFVDPDPGHSFKDVMGQVFGSGTIPSMSGFVQQALTISGNLSDTVMKGFKPENV